MTLLSQSNTKNRPSLLFITLLGLFALTSIACGDEPAASNQDPTTNANADTDVDSDSDADGDTDADADGDTNSDADGDTNSDTVDCPTALAQVRVQGTTDWQADPITAVPLDIIEFTAEDSYAIDESALTYEWSLISFPAQSKTTFDSPDVANTTMMLDTAGTYTVELSVTDANGVSACDPAQLELTAIPDSGIYVQLTWEVPASPSLTGTDLDLHYIHPDGAFGTRGAGGWEIYWSRKSGDWGDDGQASLDIDDLQGVQPESINHHNPGGTAEEPRAYSVGINYYSDTNNWGDTVATLRIYLEGDLVHERIRPLTTAGVGVAGENLGDFWYAADIPWDGVTFEVIDIDTLYAGITSVYDD